MAWNGWNGAVLPLEPRRTDARVVKLHIETGGPVSARIRVTQVVVNLQRQNTIQITDNTGIII